MKTGEGIKKKYLSSILDPLKEIMPIKTKKELSAMRILQNISVEYFFTASYDTVKKYVKKYEESNTEVYRKREKSQGRTCKITMIIHHIGNVIKSVL